MMPNKHVLYGALCSLLIYALFPQIGLLGLLIIFSSSVLIDFDHYTCSIMAGNGWSLKRAYQWCRTKTTSVRDAVNRTYIPFHSAEFFIILFILLYFSSGITSNIILYIIIGCFIHIVLDLIHFKIHGIPFYFKTCFIYTLYKNYLYLHKNIKPKHLNRGEY